MDDPLTYNTFDYMTLMNFSNIEDNDNNNQPHEQTYTYSMVFKVPDQPWPTYDVLEQCLEKVRTGDCRVFTSLEAIEQCRGAQVGDLIFTFVTTAPTHAEIFGTAEAIILQQMQNWNVGQSMTGWSLVQGGQPGQEQGQTGGEQ